MPSIIITGAASGIGKATAELFHNKGWTVGLADQNLTALEKLQHSLDKEMSVILPMDVTDAESVEKAFKKFALFQGDSLDVLFNCAGILRMGANKEIPLDHQHQIISVNVNGILNCIHYATPMLKISKNAHIISMSSASAIYGTPQFAVYSASKHAVKALTEALNIEFEAEGIIVSDIMVPFVDTPMLKNSGRQAPSVKKLGVNITPETVANTVYKASKSKRLHWQVGLPMYLLSAFSWAFPFNRRQLIKQISS